uniref:Uncharacterized protein n=1 Tax=Sphaerodactylus townsendi TaxID=933632 RepID=A0ACB8ETJ7_9SAUR
MALPLLLLLLSRVLILSPSTARPSPKALNGSAAQTEVVLAVVLPERNLSYPWAWPRVRPALALALEALQPDLQEAGLSVHIVFASSDLNGVCSEEMAVMKAVELKDSQDPDVLLGLSCGDPEFLLGGWNDESWNVPLLTAGFFFKNGLLGSTVFAGGGWPELSNFAPLLRRHFNWTSDPVFAFSSDAFDFRHPDNYPFYASDTMERMDWPLLGPMSLRTAVIYNEPEEAVEFIWAKGPVVYMFGSLEMLQQVMRLAEAENMTNGDYVFFYLDLFEESLKAEGHREAAKPWQSKEGQDGGGLREAFQTVLVITSYALQTREYQRFHSEVLLRAQKDHGVVLNVSLGQNLLAACYHDVLLLYIRALNETLREGGTKRDTSRILEKMKDLKIQGVTGTVSISSENIRKMDFAIWTMADVESGEYQVVGHYVASEKQIQWMGPIHWKKGGPPLDNFSSVSDMNDTSYEDYGPAAAEPMLQQNFCLAPDARHALVWIGRSCICLPRMDAPPSRSLQEAVGSILQRQKAKKDSWGITVQ